MSTPPDNFDELDPGPYPAYPPVDLSKEKYEDAPIGLGRSALMPKSYWAFEPWTQWGPGDYTGLRIKDLTRPIASGNHFTLADRYFVSFDADQLEDGTHEYYGRVLRIASNNESRSVIKKILCKQSIPGGRDPNDQEPWHSALLMWFDNLPEGSAITPDLVDDEAPDKPRYIRVWIQPYPNIRKNDRNFIYVDGHVHEHIVTPEQASGNKRYSVDIPGKVFRSVTKDGTFYVRMGVRDVVGNEPEGKYTLSKPYPLRNELKSTLLNMPILTLTGDELSEEVSTVDLDTQGAAQYLVLIAPPRRTTTSTTRNKIILVLDVERADKTTYTLRLPAITDRNVQSESIPLSSAFFNDIGRGRFRLSWELHSYNGTKIEFSRSYSIDVIGTPTRMPRLKLDPYQAGLIPRDRDVESEMPIYSPYASSSRETIYLRTKGDHNGAQVVTYSQLAGPEGGKRLLPKKDLKVFENKGVFEVFYEVNAGSGKPPRRSEIVEAEIGEGGGDLPAAYIQEVKENYTNFNLDLNDLSGYDVDVFFPCADTVEHDELHYNIIGGSPRSSSQGIITINKAIEGAALLELATPIPYDLFAANLNGAVDISYSVVTPGSPPIIRRSAVLRISIGEPVELQTFKLVEASATDDTIFPRALIKGGNLEMTYFKPIKGDTVTFTLEGEFGIMQHKEVVAVNPKNTVFKSHVPIEVITRGLRNDGNNIVMNCTVARGPFRYMFETLRLRLLPVQNLPKPIIRGYADTTVLPLYQLIGGASVDIAPPWPFMFAGQPVWLDLSGVDSNGDTYHRQFYVANLITESDLGKGIFAPLPIDEILQLEDGSVLEIKFWSSFPGIPLLQTATFFGETSYIIQQLPAELAFPTLVGAATIAQETTVDPLAIEKTTSVKVAYKGMLVTDEIVCKWILENGLVFEEKIKGQASGSVIADFTKQQALHNSVNGRVQLMYSVKRGDKITLSTVQTVTVNAIPAASLPKAMVNNQAGGTVIDLNTFVGNARFDIAKMPLCKAGQLIWVTFIGGGKSVEVVSAHEITEAEVAGGLLNQPVVRGVLTAWANNTAFDVEVRIAYDGGIEKFRAFVFPLVRYTKSDSFAALTTSFMYGLGPWSPGVNADRHTFTGSGLNIWTHADRSNYAGVVVATYSNFNVGHRYRASFYVFNFSPSGGINVDPVLAIMVGGVQYSSSVAPPKNTWYTLSVDFAVSTNGAKAVALQNHQNSGWGNDFIVHSANISRLT